MPSIEEQLSILGRGSDEILLREEMEKDNAVILLGEDIGPGGVQGVTAGLLDAFGDERVVDVHIGRIRQKLEVDPGNPQFVLTVRGVGYKFEDEPA